MCVCGGVSKDKNITREQSDYELYEFLDRIALSCYYPVPLAKSVNAITESDLFMYAVFQAAFY